MSLNLPISISCIIILSGTSGSVFAANESDEWICVKESAKKESNNSYLVCGVGEGANEAEARSNALNSAKIEFEQLCMLSSNCLEKDRDADPLRTTCKEIGKKFVCYRGFRYSLMEPTGIPKKSDVTKKDITLSSPIQKASYAIGYQTISSLMLQNVPIDPDTLCESITDAQSGKSSKLTLNQMVDSLNLLKSSQVAGKDISKDEIKIISYTIGRQVGENLKNQNVKIDKDTLLISIKDGLQGAQPKLDALEMKATFNDLQTEISRMNAELSADNLKKGKAFLATNKKRKGVIITKTGVQYEILKKGSGESPKESDFVTVHYAGYLIDGQKFDSSYDRGEPVQIPLAGIIKGWTEILQLMKPNSKFKVVIPTELGYGETFRPGIPANSVLVFELELLSFNSN